MRTNVGDVKVNSTTDRMYRRGYAKRCGIIANADIIKLGRKSERAALGTLQDITALIGCIPKPRNIISLQAEAALLRRLPNYLWTWVALIGSEAAIGFA